MNANELRATLRQLVGTDPAVAALVAERNDAGVAQAVNALGLRRARSRLTTSRGIYAALGTANGVAVMQVLNALAAGLVPGTGQQIPEGHPLRPLVPVFADLVPWLKPPCDGLDFGAPDLQVVITQLQAAGLFTQQQADGLKALGTEPDLVSVSTVSEVLNEGL